MNNRELLELAAKAAGIIGRWVDGWEHLGLCTTAKEDPIEEWWNPLEDDADTFRLAVDLEIDLQHNWESVVAIYDLGKSIRQSIFFNDNPVGDPRAAARLAIVRAAAELGKLKEAEVDDDGQ